MEESHGESQPVNWVCLAKVQKKSCGGNHVFLDTDRDHLLEIPHGIPPGRVKGFPASELGALALADRCIMHPTGEM